MKVKLYKTEKENYVLVDPTKGTYDDGYMLGTSRESQYNKLSIKNCQSLDLDRQTEWDVEIEMEPYYDGEFVDDGNTHIIDIKWKPVLDVDGCLILKIV